MINPETRPERFFERDIVVYRAKRGRVSLTLAVVMNGKPGGQYDTQLISNVHAAGLRQSKATNVQLMYNDEYGPFTGLFDILPLHIGVMGDVFAYGSKKEARTVRTQLGNCLYAIRKAILDEFEGLRVGQESEGYGRRST